MPMVDVRSAASASAIHTSWYSAGESYSHAARVPQVLGERDEIRRVTTRREGRRYRRGAHASRGRFVQRPPGDVRNQPPAASVPPSVGIT